ncbi:MAG: molybdopterin-dependent oxidoreductase [Pseudomonadota bacterium]
MNSTTRGNAAADAGSDAKSSHWHQTACILCAANCGVEVQLGGDDNREILRTRGDKAHPGSQGYLCNKASRLNHYQNRSDRLLSPMRRTPDGDYEPVDWDTAISEVAARLAAVRDEHGGASIFYYGGGGQGNHLPGAHARSTLGVLGSTYRSNALAQEKTGEFWVSDHMLGGWAHGDFEHCEVAVFIGKNPWQSHGIQQARATLKTISKDPDRTLIIIDPARTESADLADIHLAVKPARDAWLLAAMTAVMHEEGLFDEAFIAEHVSGMADVRAALDAVDVGEYATICGIEEAEIRRVARLIAASDRVAVFEDLGIQMNRHSTLMSYLQRLLWLPTGNYGREGTHYIANGLGGIGAGRLEGASPVTGSPLISGLVPCNLITDEVLTDHPDRFRAMIIEAVNPVHSLAESPRFREAMGALDFSVVIDVAMTETAREADYVLPSSTQFEKAEATFFNFEFPHNYFQVRHPLFEPPAGVLTEAEIHARLTEALGGIPDGVVDTLNAALDEGREAFRNAVFAGLAADPALMTVAPAVLHRTLGARLGDLQPAAVLWPVMQRFAATEAAAVRASGVEAADADLGDALFDHVINSPSGAVFSTETWEAAWARVATPDRKIRLNQPEMIQEMAALNDEAPYTPSAEFPFVLSAGERRAFTANTIIRDPDWKRKDRDGALRIHPEDARSLNLGEGALARITTCVGAVDAVVELCDRMQAGHVALPNGAGLVYPDIDDAGRERVFGPAPNELTSRHDRDKFAGTPWHKSVPARLEAI